MIASSPALRLLPAAYRPLFAHRDFRRLLPALSACDLGDGMSVVAVAWTALSIAPHGRAGLLVGAAVAAYSLPGAAGALLLGRWLRRLPAWRLLAADSWLRAVLLGCIPLAWAVGALRPAVYVALLAGSSVLHAWGGAGKYTLLARILPPQQRLAANALVSSSGSASVIVGPALAGFLAAAVSPAWIIGVDAVSFAVLAVQAGRLRPRPAGRRGQRESAGDDAVASSASPVDTEQAAAGRKVLRGHRELLGILALTWFFNFLYGPVEVALPLHVTDDLHAGARLLGLYWTLFGAGAVLGALCTGALRRLPLWPVTLGIVAGWGVALVPFGLGAPAPVTVTCFALGGLIYGPFTALSFTLFQDRTPAALLTTVLAARGAALLTAAPVGTALGGPLTAAFGPRPVLAASGLATLVLAAVAATARALGRPAGRGLGKDGDQVDPSSPAL
ncbi:Predicted arabinose efflux permease, MFS family [Actinacidiphila yanglinensis]|uniref:Predicted arabinose efflux permease, MFS family n=1 Tax=Actinacidiphila yanglinensis TaxID=310779 RepID=A0A1H6EGG9_9ACTN|nr:MFS transporter [Actinacidiphila yanglinensis]SEG95915.1 Predicted arabinose efflux permease, MFS family [Actinacidiphila yanglinensis]